ncbi:hypothetical protein Q7C_839 [Methylophaga frappieri]|uniref:Phage protein n=1 Tax=Methylophaga frappieri (strain ATCC BAA-2434 / DSM 25690 / JAM7) TaxID=754477 RepID=I1YGG5_METFJ|nr:hypothetical protein [Methylophaga frappieri]AFJ02008.1 hypothetical protein Q7C_839 [Methylophaga frappieri]
MNEPLDTSLIEERLKAQISNDVLQKIGSAADFAAVTSMSGFRIGSAYVILVDESRINPSESDRNRGKQQVRSTFGVITVARNFRGQTGAEAQQELRPFIGLIRTALVGWSPVSPWRPITWEDGKVIDYDKSTLLWADTFTTTHFISNGG